MFKSNAVRSCVELHEIELRRFCDVWETFRASGIPLPKTDDPSYQSAEHLGGHVLRAARNYLTWIGEFHSLGTARPLVLTDEEAEAIQRKLAEGWRGPVPLRSLEDAARYGLQKVRRVPPSRQLEGIGQPDLERHVEPPALPAEVVEGDTARLNQAFRYLDGLVGEARHAQQVKRSDLTCPKCGRPYERATGHRKERPTSIPAARAARRSLLEPLPRPTALRG